MLIFGIEKGVDVGIAELQELEKEREGGRKGLDFSRDIG